MTGCVYAVLPGAASAVEIKELAKVYELREPFETVRVTYIAGERRHDARFFVETAQFEREIPNEGLQNLSRPQWDGIRVVDSITPHREWEDRRRMAVVLPFGGFSRQRTLEVHFNFDEKGNMDRALYQRDRRRGEMEVYKPEWPMESKRGPLEVLRSAADDSISVHVIGDVNSPGTYRLQARSTVRDAIMAADGVRRIARDVTFSWEDEEGNPRREGPFYLRRPETWTMDLSDNVTIFAAWTGCVAAGTQVRTPSARVEVEDIREGDMVLSYDFSTGERVYRRVNAIEERVARETVLLNDRLRVTPDHRVWDGKQWTPAGNLDLESKIVTVKGESAVFRIEKDSAFFRVFSLSVEETGNFYADGILVENKF